MDSVFLVTNGRAGALIGALTSTAMDRRNEMEVQRGDRVLVNVAPFIGSLRRHPESIPCSVLEVDLPWVQVRTESPYREVTLAVLCTWIDKRLDPGDWSWAPSEPAFSAR